MFIFLYILSTFFHYFFTILSLIIIESKLNHPNDRVRIEIQDYDFVLMLSVSSNIKIEIFISYRIKIKFIIKIIILHPNSNPAT